MQKKKTIEDDEVYSFLFAGQDNGSIEIDDRV